MTSNTPKHRRMQFYSWLHRQRWCRGWWLAERIVWPLLIRTYP